MPDPFFYYCAAEASALLSNLSNAVALKKSFFLSLASQHSVGTVVSNCVVKHSSWDNKKQAPCMYVEAV